MKNGLYGIVWTETNTVTDVNGFQTHFISLGLGPGLSLGLGLCLCQCERTIKMAFVELCGGVHTAPGH